MTLPPGSNVPADSPRRNEFLYYAIQDSQGTIRAVDAKGVAALLVLVVPLSLTEHLVKGLRTVASHSIPLGILLCGFWCVSLLLVLLTLGPTANPAERIRGAKPKGAFYGGALYSLSAADFTPWSKTTANMSYEEWTNALPGSPEAIGAELAFEHMKIAYIRDVKLLRFRWALRGLIMGLAVFAFAVIYLL